jgi:hypothetical protein
MPGAAVASDREPYRGCKKAAVESSTTLPSSMTGWRARAAGVQRTRAVCRLGALYTMRLSRVPEVVPTASSPAEAMSLAPVRFRMSFARVMSSEVSQ